MIQGFCGFRLFLSDNGGFGEGTGSLSGTGFK